MKIGGGPHVAMDGSLPTPAPEYLKEEGSRAPVVTDLRERGTTNDIPRKLAAVPFQSLQYNYNSTSRICGETSIIESFLSIPNALSDPNKFLFQCYNTFISGKPISLTKNRK